MILFYHEGSSFDRLRTGSGHEGFNREGAKNAKIFWDADREAR